MKTTKTTILIILAALTVATLGAQGPGGRGFGRGFGGGLRGGWAGPGPNKVITGQPYSATQTVTTQQTIGGGNQITRTQTSQVARDGQGRISTTETITPPASSGQAAFTMQSIFDPVGGYRYQLNSSNMTAMQAPLPAPRTPPVNRPAPPANVNVVTTSLGTQTVNGQLATGTQVVETIPAGAIGNAQPIQVTRVSWVSNALQVPVQIKTSDPRFGTTDMELTAIVPAEPNASLFVVPAGYTIKTGGPGADPKANARRPGGGGGAGPDAFPGRGRRGGPGGPPPSQF